MPGSCWGISSGTATVSGSPHRSMYFMMGLIFRACPMIEETVPILRAQADVKIVGLMVSLNREEKGLHSDRSALDEIRDTWGIESSAIVTMHEVMKELYGQEIEGRGVLIDDTIYAALTEYYRTYGASSVQTE